MGTLALLPSDKFFAKTSLANIERLSFYDEEPILVGLAVTSASPLAPLLATIAIHISNPVLRLRR